MMKTIDKLKNFLEKQTQLMRKIHSNPDWKYGGFEELVLNSGIEMKYAPLPKNISRGLPKSCYYNCLKLLREHPELIYCEGFALNPNLTLPLAHAWLVDHNRKVIDPTWRNCRAAYFGVRFNTQWLMDLLVSRNREDFLSIFECNYLEKFSLLKEGLPDKAIAKTMTIDPDLLDYNGFYEHLNGTHCTKLSNY